MSIHNLPRHRAGPFQPSSPSPPLPSYRPVAALCNMARSSMPAAWSCCEGSPLPLPETPLPFITEIGGYKC